MSNLPWIPNGLKWVIHVTKLIVKRMWNTLHIWVFHSFLRRVVILLYRLMLKLSRTSYPKGCQFIIPHVFNLWILCKFSQFSSVAKSCPTLCNPMNRSTPGLPVQHQLPEFTQTHVHRVGDANYICPKNAWAKMYFCCCYCCLVAQLCLTFRIPWTAARHASLPLTISWNLPKFMSIALVMPYRYLILWCPLLPSIFPSIRDFSNESAVSIRWPKYSRFNVSISPSTSIQGWFPKDWLIWSPCCPRDSQSSPYHSLKVSILWHLPVTPDLSWLPTFAFQSPVINITSFWY